MGLTTEFLGRGQIAAQYRTLMVVDEALGELRFADFDPAAIFDEAHRHLIRLTKATYRLEGIEQAKLGEFGVYTDDTTQLLAVVESLRECGGVDRLDIARSLRRWRDEVGIGMGQSFYNAVSHDEFLTNPHLASFEYLERLSFYPAANGAVMRSAQLGALSMASPEGFHFQVADIAAVTHANPRCILSAVFAASVMAGALQGLPGWSAVEFAIGRAEDVYGHAYDEDAPWAEGIAHYRERCSSWHWDEAIGELRGIVRDIGADENLTSLAQIKPDCDMDENAAAPIGYTYLSVRLLVAAIKLELPYDVAMLQIMSLGGDADTNACVVGAVLGAMQPENARMWVWADRLLPVLKERVVGAAEGLVEVLTA